MNEPRWYSAKLRFALMVGSCGADTLHDSVYLFRADELSDAMERTLSIGRAAETRYRNGSGEDVAWRLMEVISLDALPSSDLDGAEVYSEPIFLDEATRIPADAAFAPERSKPTQTI